MRAAVCRTPKTTWNDWDEPAVQMKSDVRFRWEVTLVSSALYILRLNFTYVKKPRVTKETLILQSQGPSSRCACANPKRCQDSQTRGPASLFWSHRGALPIYMARTQTQMMNTEVAHMKKDDYIKCVQMDKTHKRNRKGNGKMWRKMQLER